MARQNAIVLEAAERFNVTTLPFYERTADRPDLHVGPQARLAGYSCSCASCLSGPSQCEAQMVVRRELLTNLCPPPPRPSPVPPQCVKGWQGPNPSRDARLQLGMCRPRILLRIGERRHSLGSKHSSFLPLCFRRSGCSCDCTHFCYSPSFWKHVFLDWFVTIKLAHEGEAQRGAPVLEAAVVGGGEPPGGDAGIGGGDGGDIAARGGGATAGAEGELQPRHKRLLR